MKQGGLCFVGLHCGPGGTIAGVAARLTSVQVVCTAGATARVDVRWAS